MRIQPVEPARVEPPAGAASPDQCLSPSSEGAQHTTRLPSTASVTDGDPSNEQAAQTKVEIYLVAFTLCYGRRGTSRWFDL